MFSQNVKSCLKERHQLQSRFLDRMVDLDVYALPAHSVPREISLLILNDGQEMEKMNFSTILETSFRNGAIRPLLCIGVHAGADRKSEYGVAGKADYLNRGSKAGEYTSFVLSELLPWVKLAVGGYPFRDISVAGFSLGGLMAMDLVWKHPEQFHCAGVFSGSLWWRSKALDDGYVEERDRIMHAAVREGKFAQGIRFFFEAGALDETADRNKNGVIDAIDDTIDLIRELERKGYSQGRDIHYLELADGKHDVETWGRAMPAFLHFAFGQNA